LIVTTQIVVKSDPTKSPHKEKSIYQPRSARIKEERRCISYPNALLKSAAEPSEPEDEGAEREVGVEEVEAVWVPLSDST